MSNEVLEQIIETFEKKLKELLEIEYRIKSGERDIDIETEIFLGKFF